MSFLSSANDSIELVKSALDAQIALATAEEKEKLANAKLALADLKLAIADLKEQNEQLSTRLKTKDEVIYDDEGRAWINGDCYCGACLGSKDKIVKLQYYHSDYYQCPACKTSYGRSSGHRKSAPAGSNKPVTLGQA